VAGPVLGAVIAAVTHTGLGRLAQGWMEPGRTAPAPGE